MNDSEWAAIIEDFVRNPTEAHRDAPDAPNQYLTDLRQGHDVKLTEMELGAVPDRGNMFKHLDDAGEELLRGAERAVDSICGGFDRGRIIFLPRMVISIGATRASDLGKIRAIRGLVVARSDVRPRTTVALF